MVRRTVLAAQSIYYLLTGAWPLASMKTFTAVTGPKTDVWLMRMVAALACTNGAALGAAVLFDEDDTVTARTLAVASAIGFAAIDVVYVMRRRISPVYLGDAAVELALAAAVLTASDD
ncbi:MAG: hypothetical protein ABR591_15570 [Candidatus Velthaea sp.]